MQRDAPRRRVEAALNHLLHHGVGQLRPAADDRAPCPLLVYVAMLIHLPHDGEGVAGVARVQGAQLLTQQPRQHGDHALHQVPVAPGTAQECVLKMTPKSWQELIGRTAAAAQPSTKQSCVKRSHGCKLVSIRPAYTLVPRVRASVSSSVLGLTKLATSAMCTPRRQRPLPSGCMLSASSRSLQDVHHDQPNTYPA